MNIQDPTFQFPFPGPRPGRRRPGAAKSQGRTHHDPRMPGGEGGFEGPDAEAPRGPHGRGRGPGGPRGFGGGFGPGFGAGFGAGFPGGFGPGMGGFGAGFGPGGRAPKGNVRSAILSLLSRHSYNGYGLIKAIAIHTDGAWRPSPGSIYPALAALQAEGLIEASGEGRRTEFGLTDAGREYVATHPEEMAQVWEGISQQSGAGADLRASIGKLMGAVHQIGSDGTEEQLHAATAALDEARRSIYKLLSE